MTTKIAIMNPKKNKLIFIDTNIYYGLFTRSEVFSDRIIKLLTKLVDKEKATLLLPQQVKDEVTRNKNFKWPQEETNRLDNKIRNIKEKVRWLEIQLDNTSYVTKAPIKQLIKQLGRESKRVEKLKKDVNTRFLSSHSKANTNLNKVFKLARLIEETEEIRHNAFYRQKKDNPPSDGDKFGDKLIWESLLDFSKNNKKASVELIFISADKTAWQSKNTEDFNEWLQVEFKEKAGGKVVYASDLSEIPSLTKAEQKEIREEGFKNTADSKLRYSNSFSTADNAMRIIIRNIELIDSDLLEKLLIAALDNNKHTPGPYNQVLSASEARGFLYKLLQHAIKRGYDLAPWARFYNKLNDDEKEYFSNTRRMLKQSGVMGIINPKREEFLDPEDLPF